MPTAASNHHQATHHFQALIDQAGDAGGGAVTVPAGSHVVGPLTLRSHVTLHLQTGAALVATEDRDAFVDRDTGRRRALLHGEGLEGVAITGRGVIDGNGEHWWQWSRDGRRQNLAGYDRPHLISLVDCRHLLFRDFTLKDSPSWNLRPIRCDDVVIDGITITAPPGSPNTDGINPESCRNVRISNCSISTGDDCITIKAGNENTPPEHRGPCEDITVTNCVLHRGHGGVVIGSEMSGGVRNVVISNCVMNGTDRGVRIKTRRGRGGTVEHVRVANCTMTDVGCVLVINMAYTANLHAGDPVGADPDARPVDDGTPTVRHVHLSGISATGVQGAAAIVRGLPERPVEHLSLQGCEIEMARGRDAPQRRPASFVDAPLVSGEGLMLKHVDHVAIRDTRLRMNPDRHQPPLRLDDARHVRLDGLQAE